MRCLVLFVLTGVLLGTPVFVMAQEEPVEADVPGGLTIHVVQRGENLFRISLAYNSSIAELVELNGLLDATRIDVGQRLLVPTIETIPPAPQTHIVQPGETFFSIAQLYDIPIETLSEENEIVDASSIYPGQVLIIAPVEESSTVDEIIPTVVPADVISGDDNLPIVSGNIHVVQQGETFFRIATGYGLSTQELAQANAISDPTVIYAGQQLVIPNLPESQLEAIDLPETISALNVQPLIFVEGETGIIQLRTDVSSTVSGTFIGRNLAFVASEGNIKHTAFVGIPMFTEGDIYTVELTINHDDGTVATFAFNVRVADGAYGSQNLNVTDANLTAPAIQENELTLLTNLTSAVTLEKSWDGLFSIPAAAAMNAIYGTLRSYNGGPISSYHSGADFASAPGTAIYAAAPGIVVMADTLNIRGNTIAIDHGWGVYTVYAHLTEFSVNLGDRVDIGQLIGTAGSTGRVTGPHLHWEVWVNGVAVNPLTWTQQVFPS